jgi:hypothetical protein
MNRRRTIRRYFFNMKAWVNGKPLQLNKRGVRYGMLFGRLWQWGTLQSCGFYLEKVKVRGVHYMNFSTTPHLTTAQQRQNVYVLWVWFAKSPLSAPSATALNHAKKQGNCLLVPLWKKQILPEGAPLGEQAQTIQQAVLHFAPHLAFSPVNKF